MQQQHAVHRTAPKTTTKGCGNTKALPVPLRRRGDPWHSHSDLWRSPVSDRSSLPRGVLHGLASPISYTGKQWHLPPLCTHMHKWKIWHKIHMDINRCNILHFKAFTIFNNLSFILRSEEKKVLENASNYPFDVHQVNPDCLDWLWCILIWTFCLLSDA